MTNHGYAVVLGLFSSVESLAIANAKYLLSQEI